MCENINYEALLFAIVSLKGVTVDEALRRYNLKTKNDETNKGRPKKYTDEMLDEIYKLNLSGKSIKKIAEMYGVSIGSISGQLYRYRKKLKAKGAI